MPTETNLVEDRVQEVTDWGRDLEILCDCGNLHPGTEISDGNRLRWYCTIEDEWKEDVNA